MKMNDLWNLIIDNPSEYHLLWNNLTIEGSDYGYMYEVVGTDEYLILGTDKKFKPNFMLFTNNDEIYLDLLYSIADMKDIANIKDGINIKTIIEKES